MTKPVLFLDNDFLTNIFRQETNVEGDVRLTRTFLRERIASNIKPQEFHARHRRMTGASF